LDFLVRRSKIDEGRHDSAKPGRWAGRGTLPVVAWQVALQTVVKRQSTNCSALLGLTHRRPRHSTTGTGTLRCACRSAFVARMRPGRADDPLLAAGAAGRMAERLPPAGLTPATRWPKPRRTRCRGCCTSTAGGVLLIVSGHCAIHCRYCFRRHFPYAAHAGVEGRVVNARSTTSLATTRSGK
jgi:L-lysine 2,3-aminomutase